jgi:hypothetical protein
MLEKTKGVIKNGQSRETGNIGYTRHKTKSKQKHNTICVRHRYAQTNKIKVNIAWSIIVFTIIIIEKIHNLAQSHRKGGLSGLVIG